MTCQEISALARYHYHPIIIIINNNGYTTEKGLDKDIKNANTIHTWNYEKLIELVGYGRYIGNIKTEKDLDLALCHCFDMASCNIASSHTPQEYQNQIQTHKNNSINNPLGYSFDYPIFNNDTKEIEWKKRLLYYQNKEVDNIHESKKEEENGSIENNNEYIKMKKNIEERKNDFDNCPSTIVDRIYSKELGCFMSFSDFWLVSKNSVNRGISETDGNKKEEKMKRGRNEKEGMNDNEEELVMNKDDGKREKSYLKLKSNYLTIIEVILEEMSMSYGSQRFVTLSQKRKN